MPLLAPDYGLTRRDNADDTDGDVLLPIQLGGVRWWRVFRNGHLVGLLPTAREARRLCEEWVERQERLT